MIDSYRFGKTDKIRQPDMQVAEIVVLHNRLLKPCSTSFSFRQGRLIKHYLLLQHLLPIISSEDTVV